MRDLPTGGLRLSGTTAYAQVRTSKPLWLVADSCRSPASVRWQATRLHVRSILPYFKMMENLHSELQRRVGAEIEAYIAPVHPQDAAGSALPQSWFADRLTEMRTALVLPYNAKIRDVDDITAEVIIKDVIIVVDDGVWTIVAYDPQARIFILAARDTDSDRFRGVDAVAIGIRGSAIDCFLAA